MKKIIFYFLALVMALSVNAAERGKFIHVDVSSAKNLKPQLAFCSDQKNGEDVTTLLVKTVDINNYKEFNDASRILLRFTDGNAIRLNRVPGSAVEKKKHSEKKGTTTITYYETYTTYEVTPEVIENLENGVAIIKVRVVFHENEHKDYDIIEGYQQKMSADLLKSYQEATQKNRKAHNDTSDDDF